MTSYSTKESIPHTFQTNTTSSLFPSFFLIPIFVSSPASKILCYYEGAYYGEKKGGDSKTGLPFFSGLPGGTKKIIFDATDPGEPAEIVIGVGGVIPGWEIGT